MEREFELQPDPEIKEIGPDRGKQPELPVVIRREDLDKIYEDVGHKDKSVKKRPPLRNPWSRRPPPSS